MKKNIALTTLLMQLTNGRAQTRRGDVFRRLVFFVTVIGALVFVSIDTASAHIDSLLPNQWTAGGPAFTLRLLGRDFDESDTERVLFNGRRVTVTLISDRELQAAIPASLLLSPGTVVVALEGFNSVNFTINPPLTITTVSALPDAIPGQPYSQTLMRSGGTAPFTWSGLPAGYGLRLSSDGQISGTAIPVESAFEFEAAVTDAANLRAVKNFLIRIKYPCAGSCLIIEDIQVTEGDTGTVAAEFKVRLSRPSSDRVTVDYSTQDFTSAAPNDYIAGSGTLGFNSGVTLNSIVVIVRGDTLYEAAEQFFVNLTNPVNASIGRGQGIGTIFDDDPGSLAVCSNDVPKQSRSTITIDRDGIIDEINVSLFLKDNGVFFRLYAYLIGVSQEEVELLGSEEKGPFLSGQQLGTACSPSPNCVFDDDAQTFIYDGEPSYVGTFRPKGKLRALTRKNAKGTWGLRFGDGAGGSPTLNCWCLRFNLPREGCRLEPATATVPIFSPYTVRALLTSNGAPLSGQVVSFTVRGEQDELRLQQDITSNSKGAAELSYYDFKPGPNYIEARATVNGVLSLAKAEVTWVANGLSRFSPYRVCAVEESSADTPGGETILSSARNFRDDVLATSPRGKSYTNLYYKFSTEAVQIMMFNPMLMLRSREILERYRPVIQAMVKGDAVTLTQGDLDEINGFMNAFAAKGSPELEEAIKGVCDDLRDPQMHSEFGITVTDGPKRELPSSEQLQTIKQMGGLTTVFGLCGLVFFAITGNRRKTLRRHAPPMLVVVLAVSVVGNSGGQWSAASGLTIPSGRRSVVSQTNNADSTSSISEREAQSRVAQRYLRQPMAFESNRGQIDSQVKFVSRNQGYTMFLTPTEAVMSLRRQEVKGKRQKWELSQPSTDHRPPTTEVLRMKLIGANPEPKIEGLDRLPAVSNYFIGNDPARWRANVPAFARVKYEAVYPGVDLVYYGNQQQLEYDFIVAPGADPGVIGLAFDGADKIEVDKAGDLVLSISGGEVRQRKPLVYQEVNGARQEMECHYIIRNSQFAVRNPQSEIRHMVGFEIAAYDTSRPLIIDPVLEYSTYLGGRGNDEGTAVAVDSAGNAYVVGFTDSPNFPTANGAQAAFGGGLQDAFVSKLDPSGTQLLYSTYIGGNGQDNGSAITVDAAGNAYVTGYTGSTNFPVLNAMQPFKNGQFNAFVAKLNPTGGLLYSTHLGGSTGDYGSSIAVDSSSNVYVAGVATSPNFPVAAAIQTMSGGAADVYVAKLNASGNQLVYSTYLGGAGNDGATSIAVDSAGNLYLTGVTTSPNFRTANPVQAAHSGGLFDAFVAKLNPTGTQFVYSTYLGGTGEDRGFRIAVDAAGNAYVTGDTDSPDFPTANAFQRIRGGGVDAFVAKLNPTGTALTYSTYLGGSSIEGGTAIAVDSAGSAYVTGFTGSTNYPTVAALQQVFGGGSFDGFVAKLNAAGSALDYSTYLGGSGIDSGFGIAADASGNAYVMGVTDSINFPVVNAFQQTNGGGNADLFIAKIKSSGLAITGAMVEGKRLFVFGSGFDIGAKILIDGQAQKSANDDQNPGGALIGKKAGKKVKRGRTATLQVRNSDGALSNEFRFTRP